MLPTKLSRIQKVIKKCKKSSSNSVDFVHAAKTPILRFPLMAAHLWKAYGWCCLSGKVAAEQTIADNK